MLGLHRRTPRRPPRGSHHGGDDRTRPRQAKAPSTSWLTGSKPTTPDTEFPRRHGDGCDTRPFIGAGCRLIATPDAVRAWRARLQWRLDMATATKDVPIELPALKIGLMEVTLISDSPLIVHAWSQKAKLEMLGKQMKKAKAAKEAKDPRADYEAAMYRTADGGYGFPSVAFKNAAVTA